MHSTDTKLPRLSGRERGALFAEMLTDPADMGALLTAAFRASGITLAELARRTGMAANNVGRAMRNPDARNPAVRAILRALGARLVLGAVSARETPMPPAPAARRRYDPKTGRYEPVGSGS